MLIGSGLLARAFSDISRECDSVCVYAAGVSNSHCTDAREFSRERQRLTDALRQAADVDTFIYFGTCSVSDPDARNTPYVQHKLEMEQLARAHTRNLILRLPQVAGRTSNPHTLLNFLYASISRSERFTLWSKARRNIIDVVDVVSITQQLVADRSMRNRVINVANTSNYPVAEIVRAMEHAVGKSAIFDTVERGTEYEIDTHLILPVMEKIDLRFDGDYLQKVVNKYYS